jgi:hypothetical protein
VLAPHSSPPFHHSPPEAHVPAPAAGPHTGTGIHLHNARLSAPLPESFCRRHAKRGDRFTLPCNLQREGDINQLIQLNFIKPTGWNVACS